MHFGLINCFLMNRKSVVHYDFVDTLSLIVKIPSLAPFLSFPSQPLRDSSCFFPCPKAGPSKACHLCFCTTLRSWLMILQQPVLSSTSVRPVLRAPLPSGERWLPASDHHEEPLHSTGYSVSTQSCQWPWMWLCMFCIVTYFPF